MFRDGPDGQVALGPRAPAGFRSFERPSGASFSPFARATWSAIGLGPVFSLGRASPPVRAALSSGATPRVARARGDGALTRSGGGFLLTSPPGSATPHSAPSGRARPASLAATGNPCWCLLLGVLICLSPARRLRPLGGVAPSRAGLPVSPAEPAGGYPPPSGRSPGGGRAFGNRCFVPGCTASRCPPRPSSRPEPRHPPVWVLARQGIRRPGTGPAPPRDPSAGSPTDTLLRLLLPPGARARRRSPGAPGDSPRRPVGRSDGRCVQGAGTHPARVGDTRLRDIPGSRGRSSPRSQPRAGLAGRPASRPRARCPAQCSTRAAQGV